MRPDGYQKITVTDRLLYPLFWVVSRAGLAHYALDPRSYSWSGPRPLRWSHMRYWCWWQDVFFDRQTWVEYLIRVKCRWHGHPAGIVFYNPGGLEPNTHCSNCGEDIG